MRKKIDSSETAAVSRAARSHVASLEKGLAVLTCFGRQHGKLTLSEVSRLTNSSPASARRALLTLETLEYVESDGKRFWLLPKALLIAHAYLGSPRFQCNK